MASLKNLTINRSNCELCWMDQKQLVEYITSAAPGTCVPICESCMSRYNSKVDFLLPEELPKPATDDELKIIDLENRVKELIWEVEELNKVVQILTRLRS